MNFCILFPSDTFCTTPYGSSKNPALLNLPSLLCLHECPISIPYFLVIVFKHSLCSLFANLHFFFSSSQLISFLVLLIKVLNSFSIFLFLPSPSKVKLQSAAGNACIYLPALLARRSGWLQTCILPCFKNFPSLHFPSEESEVSSLSSLITALWSWDLLLPFPADHMKWKLHSLEWQSVLRAGRGQVLCCAFSNAPTKPAFHPTSGWGRKEAGGVFSWNPPWICLVFLDKIEGSSKEVCITAWFNLGFHCYSEIPFFSLPRQHPVLQPGCAPTHHINTSEFIFPFSPKLLSNRRWGESVSRLHCNVSSSGSLEKMD